MKPEELKKEEQVNLENDIIDESEADALKGGKADLAQDSVAPGIAGLNVCCNL
ncbi:hypothetical protein [Dysgonomonas termitidis]|uniref:Class IIb bacteriocin, lactobin A/cerein 7B family n=1 Tax=Dysgonomonas termitidis TaxID=1516126 RepID=A0ABV9KZ82_9BACT